MIDTTSVSPAEAAEQILSFLRDAGYLRGPEGDHLVHLLPLTDDSVPTSVFRAGDTPLLKPNHRVFVVAISDGTSDAVWATRAGTARPASAVEGGGPTQH